MDFVDGEPIPIPRLCLLTKPSGYDEYGFNLHAEMGRGQFVGAVDIGSAAQMAGLRPGDHIVAVNGESIEGLSHKEVVQRIKSNPMRCSLLVLDEEGILWFKERNLPYTAENLLKRPQKEENAPIPVPRGKTQLANERHEIGINSPASAIGGGASPSFGDLAYNTEESGSCSIALPLSSPGSPYSHHRPVADEALQQQEEQTPMPHGTGKQDQKQYHLPHSPLVQHSSIAINSTTPAPPAKSSSFESPHPTPHHHPSSPKTAIGRHAAVPVPPPGTLLANGPKPRLCVLKKSSPSQEFGFNLHAEGRKGHFIGAVDKEGIAERAGLETGQRIVGVNGRLIFPNTPHKEIVQLIKRDPLRTELLVASEEVDRFYSEYGLAFNYEFVQIYDPLEQRHYHQQQQGAFGGEFPSGKHPSPKKVAKPSASYNHQEQRNKKRTVSSSGTSNSSNGSSTREKADERKADLRVRGNSLGQRPPTPTSTYTESPQNQHQNNHHHHQQLVVAVQIEQRPDNMTSIEIGELDDDNMPLSTTANHSHNHQYIGIGTPPSSRCDEKSEKEEEQPLPPPPPQLQQPIATTKQQNGFATHDSNNNNDDEEDGHQHVPMPKQEHKHVIASGPPPPANPMMAPNSRHHPPAPVNYQPFTAIFPSQQQLPNKTPLPLPPQSPFEKRGGDFGKDIFTLNAKEARKAICGRKRDPRLEGHMTLEEKHRLILDL